MTQQIPIAQAEFDIRDGTKMTLAIFKPRFDSAQRVWGCKFHLSAPLDVERIIFGENALQSLVLALKIAATTLYASELYKNKDLGIFGEFGGSLLLPAPHTLLDIAPFPF
jgi:hypothetical protein